MSDIDEAIISAKKVSKSFEVAQESVAPLKEVSFEIKKNSFTIVYGPSGSGKTTLLNTLTGLLKPTSGNITFFGKNIYNLSPDEIAYFRANNIGQVYQSNYWVNSLSVLENVSLPLYFLGYSRSRAAKQAMQSLERINMGSYAKKMPNLLSGGEQQRVAIARGIVSNPKVIVADEPTGALDSANGERVINLLQTCQLEFRQTVILVTHNMEYLPLADNLLHIQDGQVETMDQGGVKNTAKKLIDEMQERIDRMSDERKKAKGKNAGQ